MYSFYAIKQCSVIRISLLENRNVMTEHQYTVHNFAFQFLDLAKAPFIALIGRENTACIIGR